MAAEVGCALRSWDGTVLVVRVKGQRTQEDADPRKLGFTEAFARVGALVVRLAGVDGTDPRTLLPAALTEARTALKP